MRKKIYIRPDIKVVVTWVAECCMAQHSYNEADAKPHVTRSGRRGRHNDDWGRRYNVWENDW